MSYISSTKVGVCHREYNRHTQVNRYKEGKAIQVELAIRWWVSQDNYPTFTTIAIHHFDNYAEAWTYEHAVIEQKKHLSSTHWLQNILHGMHSNTTTSLTREVFKPFSLDIAFFEESDVD